MQTADLRGSRLSFQQARLWSLQTEPQAFRVQCSLLLEGSLDTNVLQAALRDLVARHEILRTAFRRFPGVSIPMQVIAEQAAFAYSERSLETLSREQQQHTLDRFFAQEQETPFDFSQYPLLRISVFRLHGTRHVLLFSLPALCADAVSLRLFTTLLLHTYTALFEQREPDDEPLQYVDVVAWQQELLQGEDAEEHLSFWKSLASIDFSRSSLPFRVNDAPFSVPTEPFHPLEHTFTLDTVSGKDLILFAQKCNVSCEAVLLACWQLLHWRFTNNPQVLLGYLCNGRSYDELSDAPGAYSRVVPLHYSFHDRRSFVYLTQQCQQLLETLREHQYHFSWSLLHAPADQFLPLGFSFDTWPAPIQEGLLRWQLLRCYHLLEHFLLHLSVIQHGEDFSLSLLYEPEAFSLSQVQRLAHSLSGILRIALEQPQRALAGWPVLEEQEQRAQLQRFGGTPPADTRSLLRCFEDYTANHPAQPALRYGDIQLSYWQLNARANQLAHWLQRTGVGADVPVALYLERGVEMLIGALGVLKAGGAYIPLDPGWPRERLRLVLGEMAPVVLLTQGHICEQVPAGPWQVKLLDEWSWLAGEEESNGEELADEQSLAYILYTSGSTGTPKGVGVRRSSLRHYAAALREALQVQAGWQYALVSTLAADLGNTVIYSALTGGGCLHILPYETVTQGEALAEYIQRFNIDVLKIVPSHLQAVLLHQPGRPEALPMRHLILGGEALTWDLLKEVEQANAQCMVWNHYGPTEATIGVLLQPLGKVGELKNWEQGVPLGKPIGGNSVYIADAWQQIVPVGVIGELYIAGEGLARGYLGRERETAERFLPDPYGKDVGGRVYRTGDLARYREDGEIEFIGRKDRQIKIRGYRVEPGEIEAALQEHERVRDAIVQLREGRIIGYALSQQPLPSGLELREWMKARVPEYMVPAAIVRLLAWPLTTNGKIDLQGLPEPEEEEERVIVGARTLIEELLLLIWQEVLHVQGISVYDNFFHLNGHSLLATQVISRVRLTFNVNISIRHFFEEPTIAALAASIEQARREEEIEAPLPPLVPVSRAEPLPLSFAQQRLWFLAQLDPQDAAYNLPHALRLRGPLHRDVLEACFLELLTRHEVLRTTFELRDGQPIQQIHTPGGPVVQYEDLTHLSLIQQEQEIRWRLDEEVQTPFDLVEGPLLRVKLLGLREQEHLLLLTMHHIVSDGWSSTVLVQEFSALYTAYLQGQTSPLSPLPVQYADYAVWQRGWLQGEQLRLQEKYWQEQLMGITPLQLPTDHLRPPEQSTRGALQMMQVPEGLRQQLRELAQQEGVTMFMLLLAAFQVLLGRYSGQEDIVVGTPIANRTQAETEGLIGFFVNTLVLRTDLSGSPSFREVLRRVREVSLGAYVHQDLPFEYLVERLQPERDRSRHPLFQVMFSLQNIPGTPEPLADIEVELLPFEQQSAKFDLSLVTWEREQGIVCAIEYNTDLFEARTITRLLQWYQGVLEALVTNVEYSAFHHPSLLTSAEAQRLYAWNQTARRTPLPASFSDCWQEQVSQHGSNLAVVWGEQRVSYAQLDARVQHLARQLHTLGAGPERVVAVHLERSLDWVVSLLAILAVGAVYLPLEPDLPARRLAGMLLQARPWTLLTRTRWQEALEPLLPAGSSMLALPEEGLGADLEPEEVGVRWEGSRWGGEQLAYMLYTSGSTGTPKGAMVHQQGLLNHLFAKVEALGLSEQDRVGQNASQSFDISLWQVLAVLLVGGAVVGFSQEQRGDPRQFCGWVRREQVSVIEVVPSFVRAILEEEGVEQGWEASVRWVVVTGEAFGKELAQRWQRRYPGMRMLNAYGPTECSDDVTHQEVEQGEWEEEGGGSVPIGRGLPQTRLYVLDRWGMEVPIGMQGELYVGGSGVGRGYVGEAGKTAERYVPDALGGELGGRLYRTGDVVRYGERGELEYVGRVDEQVKVRGYRIELGEIEVWLGRHPQVSECVVRVREEHLIAYVVPIPDGEDHMPGTRELQAYLQERLPGYMVPARFVYLAVLPLTSNGKVDRRALEVLAEEEEKREEREEPGGAVEEALAEIWAELLEKRRIGRQDSFFELGGHSLLAMRVLARVRSIFRIELPLRKLFEEPTIAGLAIYIEQALRGGEEELLIAPLVPVGREMDLPLSFAQQRLWLLDQIEPGNAAYNIPNAILLRGPLDKDILEQSLREVVKRHEVLRTTFKVKQGQAVQVINSWEDFAIRYEDWSVLDSTEQKSSLRQVIGAEASRPFDLIEGPLLRVSLIGLNVQEHVLLLTMHHIIADGWSMGLLQREITALYSALQKGLPSPLSELTLQYADYAVWQRSWLQGEVLDRHLEYWKHQLQELTPLGLPIDYPRPARQRFKGALQTVVVPTSLVVELRKICQQEGTTLFMLLLAAFQTLLARYSGQEDIAVGIPVANRTHTEIEKLIGFFINTLVLRTNLSGNPTFQEVLARVREVCLGAYAHQEIPFERLIEELQPERDLSRSPLFQVMLVLQNLPVVNDTFVGLAASSFEREQVAARYEITLTISELEQGLFCELVYNTELFEAQTITRLLGHWLRLLSGIAAQPETRLIDLPLLTEVERQQILAMHRPVQEYAQNRCITQLFEEQVMRTPLALAVSYEGENIAYWEVNELANRLAWFLIEQGVGPEVPVGLYAERSPRFMVAVLAVWKAGGIHVPIDPGYQASRVAQIISQSNCSLILTNERLHARLEHSFLEAGVIESTPPRVAIIETILAEGTSQANPPLRCEQQNIAYIIYTSGSTGVPKGVMVEHGGMLNHIYGKIADLQITWEDIVIQNGPPCFDIIIWQCFAALLVGGSVQVLPNETAFDPIYLLEQTEQCRASVLQLVPSMLREIIQEASLRGTMRPPLAALRWIVPTGDALPAELCQRWLELYPAIPILNTYGSTECSDDQCHYTIKQLTFRPEVVPVAPIGYPIANIQVYILDPTLSLVPVGFVGELYIGGAGVGRGYLHDPGRTAAVFLPDPFGVAPGGRLYKTGDQARYLAEGSIEFLGRVDNLVKIRGYRIEVGEIEVVLAQHPHVLTNAVVAHTNEQGETYLVAYVVSDPQHPLERNEVHAFLQGKLPAPMQPARIIALEALPLTPLGKLDRKALSKIDLAEPERFAQGVEPRNPTEEAVAEIWKDILGLDTISIRDNFFRLGGHSLLATRITARIRTILGIELPLRTLFEAPTVAGLAQQITQSFLFKQDEAELPALSATQQLEGPLSFAQRRLWFLDQLEPANPAYILPLAARLSGPLDLEVLRKSVDEVVRRHQVLRTTFHLKDGEPAQRVHSPERFNMRLLDGSNWTDEEREYRVMQLIAEEIARPFHLQKDFPFRMTVLHLSVEEHVLLAVMHHIIADAWSIGLFLQELTLCYRAFERQQVSPLSALPVQYIDYALWQQEWLQGARLQQQQDYWVKQLSGSEPLTLPADYPRPAVQAFHGAHQAAFLPQEVVSELKQVCQQEGVTMFMLLLAAFQVLLARYSGQDDIVVGTPIANRTLEELEPLIGFFVNTLVLRTDLTGNPTLRDVLQRVRQVALEAYAHQDMPFERLVEVLHPRRDLSRSPLFQVMFILQNVPGTQANFGEHLTLEPLAPENMTAKFDLTFSVTERPQGLWCVAEYNTDLFAAESVKRLLEHWQRLLFALQAQREQPIRSLDLLGQEEANQLLHIWNATKLPLEGIELVPQQILEQARRRPDDIAIEDASQRLCYAQVARRSAQVALLLWQAGVRAGDRVGVCLPRSVDLVVGLLAVLRMGATYVPLDPEYPAERLHFMVDQSDARIVLTVRDLEGTVSLPERVKNLLVEDEMLPDVEEEDLYIMQAQLGEEDVAYIIYTSGSTGYPKGVAISQGALRNSFVSLQTRLGLGEQDRVLAVTSLSFDIAGLELLQPLTMGAQIRVLSRAQANDGEELSRQLKESRATVFQATPASWRLLLQAGWQGQEGLQMLCGGEALPVSLAKDLVGKGRALWNMYGPTETTIWSTCQRIEAGAERILIGGPIGNTQVYVLDKEGRPVPQGVVGEFYIGGASVATGYWGQGRLTAERFVPDPFTGEAGARLYRTGDEVRWVGEREASGLEYMGRRDQQVKVRGYRIELGEIEGALEQQAEITGAIVGVEGAGEEKYLVGYIVRKEGKVISEQEIRRKLREQVPGYMVPERIVFLEAWPLTPNGKVDRRALPALSQQTETVKEEHEQLATLPGPIESILIDIWESVLKREGIKVSDNFFDLGGHSLLATQVIVRLQRAFTPAISVLMLFEAPSIAELAQRIERVLAGERAVLEFPALEPVSRTQPLLLSFAQQRLWFQDRLDPGNPAYNITLAVRVQGALKVDILEHALREIVSRHEILRTTYRYENEQIFQLIGPVEAFCLRQSTISVEDGTPQQNEVSRLTRAEAEQPFDLVTGPLFRAHLLRLDEGQEYILLVTMHHIVADAWSLQIFLHELVTFYAAFAQGKPASLPALPIQYADFAQWQRRWFQGRPLEKLLDYWTKQLRGAHAFDLPADHPRSSALGNRSASYTFSLPVDLTQGLITYSQREEVTLFMTLLTAFQVLLSRLTDNKDILVGTDIANRTHIETEGLIGFFVNLLALRVQLEGQPLFHEVLQQVRAMVLEAYVHQDIPFDYLVEQLHLERSGGLTPLVNVLFVMQNIPEIQTMASLPGLTVNPIDDMTTQHAKFDAAFFLIEGSDGLRGRVNYNADLFEESTIARLVQRYESLLRSILAHPDYPIHLLEITTANDKTDLATRRDSRRSKLKASSVEGIDLE